VAATIVEARDRNAADSIIYQCYSRRRMPRRPEFGGDGQTAAVRMVQVRQARCAENHAAWGSSCCGSIDDSASTERSGARPTSRVRRGRSRPPGLRALLR
jgi:hypothetical protein